jgi:hypothetical protein
VIDDVANDNIVEVFKRDIGYFLFEKYQKQINFKHKIKKLKLVNENIAIDINNVLYYIRGAKYIYTMISKYDGKIVSIYTLLQNNKNELGRKGMYKLVKYIIENDKMDSRYIWQNICDLITISGLSFLSDEIKHLASKTTCLSLYRDKIYIMNSILLYTSFKLREVLILFKSYGLKYSCFGSINNREYYMVFIDQIVKYGNSHCKMMNDWLLVGYVLRKYIKNRNRKFKKQHHNKFINVIDDILYIPPKCHKLMWNGGMLYNEVYKRNQKLFLQ